MLTGRRVPGRGIRYRSGMRNWADIAQASGLNLSARESDRITQALNALEDTFRPLVTQLTPDLEPDVELHLDEDGQ